MSHPREETLAHLVARYLEESAKEQGGLSIDEVCCDHPELLEDVRRSVSFAGDLEELNDQRGPVGRIVGELVADRYRVLEPVGSGAMGVVYAAEDLELGRTVALKIVHTGLMDREMALKRFEREAAALASITHPSVVTIYDRGVTAGGLPFLVMEYLEGLQCSDMLELARVELVRDDETQWLCDALQSEGLEESSYLRQVFRWGASLASGLEAAHEAGVFHRDIKPSNIMLCQDGRAVLLDFGIATREDSDTLTRTGMAVGTPAYMAPESLLPGRRPNAQLDVYGLAATLYHLLTLRAPFEGSPVEIFSALATREPAPASRVRPGLPRDAQAILDVGMAHSPGARYPSAQAIQKDLESLVAYRPISVRPTSALTRSFRRLRRSRAMMGGGVVLLGIAALFGIRRSLVALDQKRQDAYFDSAEHAPANLTIVGYSNRKIESVEARAAIEVVLDGMVESGHDTVPAMALRAAFRLDHGDVVGAQSDMGRVASLLGTDYSSALAQCYGALPADSSSAGDLDLEELPSPSGPMDKFLVGYHLMRTLRYVDARPWLSDDELKDVRQARELFLVTKLVDLVQLKRNRDGDGLYAEAEKLKRSLDQLEDSLGGASATTWHLRSTATLMGDRFSIGLAEAEQGLALSAWSHVTLINAANAARHLAQFSEADAYCVRGLQIVPGYQKLEQARIDTALDKGDFSAARAHIESSSYPDDGARKLTEQLRVDLNEAFTMMEDNREAADALCRNVLSWTSDELQGHPKAPGLERSANAILSRESSALLLTTLESLAETPTSGSFLPLLANYLSEQDLSSLGEAEWQALVNWITELEGTLSQHSRLGEPRPR